jgi:hypothetical protein
MIPIPETSYPLEPESWGYDPDRTKANEWSQARVNTYIAWRLAVWKRKEYTGQWLWEEFKEDFEEWSVDWFTRATMEALKEIRTYLVRNGVWVRPQAGSNSYAKVLQEVIREEARHEWTDAEIQEHTTRYGIEPDTRTNTGAAVNILPIPEPSPQGNIRQTPGTTPGTLPDVRQPSTAREETPRPPPQAYERFSPTPHPVFSQQYNLYEQQLNPANPKLLTELMKVYKDDKKYGGEEYDILDVKLQVFFDYCRKIGLGERQFHLAFSTMLKDKASDFYYDKIAGRSYDFRTMVDLMRSHFETEENRQKYLSEWRETTLMSMISKNPDKSKLECLELMLNKLRTAQRGLTIQYQNENSLRDQVLNACRGIEECNLALFKPAPTFEGLCADLRSAIGQTVRTKEVALFFEEAKHQYWTDRTYGGTKGRFPSRTNIRGRGKETFRGRGTFRGTSARDPDQKCFVCKQTGCWSTHHSDEERKQAYDKYKDQMLTDWEVLTKEDLQSFLAEYEGTPDRQEIGDQTPEQWTVSLNVSESLYRDPNLEHSHFLTESGQVDGLKTVSLLQDQTVAHIITRNDMFQHPYETSAFTFEGRYSSETFQGIMPDTGAAGISTAGEPQLQALQKTNASLRLDRTTAGDHRIRFGKGSTIAKGTVTVDTPLGPITFHIVPENTPFLYCIQDMDRMGVKLDNLQNVLVQGKKVVPIVRKWGHPWMLLNRTEETVAYCHLTYSELHQLHRRFGHPSVRRLVLLLERAKLDNIDVKSVERLTRFCEQCQLHAKSPGRFKFTLKDDYDFNYSVQVDVFYLDSKPVLHVVDEATSFMAARFLKDESARTVWDTLRTCWIDTYLGPPDYFVHDAGKNFSSIEFQREARTMAVDVKEVPVEAHNSIGKVEQRHAPLRRAYNILQQELRDEHLDKHSILQMAVKAVNDTAGPNGLVPTLLVFGAYPRMTRSSAPSASMIKRAEAVQTAMTELKHLNAKRQIKDALTMKNGPNTASILNLPLQSDVRVWRERRGWMGPYKLLDIDRETCTIDMPYGPTKFRSTVVKPFYIEELPEVDKEQQNEPQQNNQPETDIERKIRATRPMVIIPNRSVRQLEAQSEHFLTSVREDQQITMAFITKKEESDLELAKDLRQKGVITIPGQPFQESQQREIDGLIARGVFEFVRYNPNVHKGRIFNSRLVNEVKGKSTETPYEKSRLVIQAYNDIGKGVILTQSPTIQRASQRLILALAPSLVRRGIKLFSRDITQAYVQSTTFLNRLILSRVPAEIRHKFPEDTIMVVRKPLYGIPEAGTHWWATYSKHHQEKLGMKTSSYDPCLLITTSKDAFGVVGMQTDDTLILGDDNFAKLEQDELEKAKLSAKPVDTLSYDTPLIFNGGILRTEGDDIILVQKGQGKKLQLVDIKSDTRTEEYREQRARGAYLATICQPEASFDLSVAAQYQEPSDEEIKVLNKRLKWQLDNLERGIRYIPIDLHRTKLFVFVDGSFANNKDLSSQLGYEITLANELYDDNSFTIRGNLIHWSSTKSKRVTRSVLASELYGMVGGVDMALAINSTIQMIVQQLDIPPPPIIVCTDSYSLYECLVKLGTTKEKRLMIDIMALRQSYERRELTEVRWINGQDNPADAMTKATPNRMLQEFLDNNEITVRLEGWVKREEKESQIHTTCNSQSVVDGSSGRTD